MYNHLNSFLSLHSKLSPFQHGFREGHSCQTQLLETVHKWALSLNASKSVHVAFLDFSKAFDTVPHQCLLTKLDHIGIRGDLLTWIKGFLTNRRQHVVCDGAASDWVKVISGVPQGSILGPLFFLIYINDIGEGLSSQTRLFADDCTVFREICSTQDCSTLQADLGTLFAWTQKWQLTLNTSKCKVMCITNRKIPHTYTYHVNNSPLEWVDAFKYLGVKINKKLNWGDHIAEATSKATRVLNLLRRTMYGCHKDAKRKAYVALVPSLKAFKKAWFIISLYV